MSQALPIGFWQQGRDEPEGYIWCRHVKRYLRWQFSNCPVHRLVDSVGFEDYHRFERSLNDWLGLQKPIPASFMDVIDADTELLESILEIDQREFEYSLLRTVSPKFFWTEDLDGSYVPQPLPLECTEAGCIAHVQRYLRPRPDLTAYLHWPYLKTILFEGGRAMMTVEYRPRLRLEQDHYSFGPDGSTLPVSSE